jgi:HD-GYP domain-containing protein (c-di-GMP phosphodiesterase class II)
MRLRATLLVLVLSASLPPLGLVAALATRSGGDGRTFLAAVASLLFAAVLTTLVARSITRPIAECVRGAVEIARGGFGREVRVGARNEIGDLAYTFNHMSRELASYDAENRRLIEALEHGYLDTIRSLASAIDAKDPYTRGHAERVAALAVEVGRRMGLRGEALAALERGGILHDVGKIGIPDAILTKRGALTREELDLVHAHPRIGAEIVGGVAFLAEALPAIRGHHERWDGSGYPDGLAGERIPLVARIVSAADTWDALTSDRPYQAARGALTAEAILAGLRGTQLDPAVHDALLAVVRERRRDAA